MYSGSCSVGRICNRGSTRIIKIRHRKPISCTDRPTLLIWARFRPWSPFSRIVVCRSCGDAGGSVIQFLREVIPGIPCGILVALQIILEHYCAPCVFPWSASIYTSQLSPSRFFTARYSRVSSSMSSTSGFVVPGVASQPIRSLFNRSTRLPLWMTKVSVDRFRTWNGL